MIQQFASALRSVVVSHSATPQYKPSLRVRFQSSTMSNSIDQMCEVLCRRTPIDTRPRRFARLQVRQQCRTPSTLHVVTTQPFPEFNNVELHRSTVRSPVQTNSSQHSSKAVRPSPSTSTMSNSIDSRRHVCQVQQCRTPSTSRFVIITVPPFNNVELHRQSKSSEQCRTPSTIQADPSCVQSWDSSRTKTRRIE